MALEAVGGGLDLLAGEDDELHGVPNIGIGCAERNALRSVPVPERGRMTRIARSGSCPADGSAYLPTPMGTANSLRLALAVALTVGCNDSSSPGGPTGGPPVAADPGSWEVRRALGIPRTENSVAELNGAIWVVGGFGATGAAVTAVERYDPAADAWTTAASLPQRVNHAGLAAIEGRLIVIGGNVGNTFTPTATVRAYDPETDAWSLLAPLLAGPRSALAVAVVDGKLHAIGGVDGTGPVGTHEIYDPATDTWSAGPSLPTPREHLAAAVLDGRIHALAGRRAGTNLGTHEVFDPASGTWSAAAPAPTPRSGVAAATLGGRLYLFGGEDLRSSATFDDAERFDPGTGSWEAVAPMPTSRHGLGAAVLGGSIWVVGGGPQAGLTTSGANERFTP